MIGQHWGAFYIPATNKYFRLRKQALPKMSGMLGVVLLCTHGCIIVCYDYYISWAHVNVGLGSSEKHRTAVGSLHRPSSEDLQGIPGIRELSHCTALCEVLSMDYVINTNAAFSQQRKEALTSASLGMENVFNEKVFALKHKYFFF